MVPVWELYDLRWSHDYRQKMYYRRWLKIVFFSKTYFVRGISKVILLGEVLTSLGEKYSEIRYVYSEIENSILIGIIKRDEI